MKLMKLLLINLSIIVGLYGLPVQADHQNDEENHTHHTNHTHKITVQDAYVRATPPGVKNSAGYFTLVNHYDQDLMLVGVMADIAQKAELHNHFMHDGVMSMRKIQSVHVPAHKKVLFQPSGLHVMLFDFAGSLVAGENVKLTLLFNNGDKIPFTANIVAPHDIPNQHNKPKKGEHKGHSNHAHHAHH